MLLWPIALFRCARPLACFRLPAYAFALCLLAVFLYFGAQTRQFRRHITPIVTRPADSSGSITTSKMKPGNLGAELSKGWLAVSTASVTVAPAQDGDHDLRRHSGRRGHFLVAFLMAVGHVAVKFDLTLSQTGTCKVEIATTLASAGGRPTTTVHG
ncbi:hypothetical protein C8Q76DRAFT_692419 [Earliella scabrosa]|nr:hypothetical protein C8Q76DRAFT_692419 [Earliella scabrosa]